MREHEESVLQANAEFYRAFDQGDLPALAELWAEHHPVACIHPGREAVHGRKAVLASWHLILKGPQPPRIACQNARAFVHADSAFVVCTERLDSGCLVATNVFAEEGGRWRLVHHQAGPAPDREESPAAETVH